MTRDDAIHIIYEIINSGIITEELSDDLTKVCNHICNDDFEMCEYPPEGHTNYCEGCKFQKTE